MSMVTGLAAGVSIEAAVSHGLTGLARRPRDGTRIAFAVAAAAVATGAIAVVAMYSAGSAEDHAALMKWLLYPSSTVWTVAVVWLVAFYTGVCPRRFLLALTAGFAVMLVVDVVLPLGILHDEVGVLQPMDVAGGHAMDIGGVSPHPLHLITVVLTAVALGFLFYALVAVHRRGERRKAAYLAVAVLLFALSMLVDILSDYGVITSFYTTQLFFAGVVLVTSVALRRESLRDEEELRRYRTELESLVEARVVDLDQANEQLAEENRVRLAAEEALRRRVAELDALQHLSQTLASRTDLASALEKASAETAALLHASGATVRLTKDAVRPVASTTTTVAAGVAGGADPLTARAAVVEREGRAMPVDGGHVLSVPMVTRGTMVGVLDVRREPGGSPFGSGEEKVAQTVADALAAAVENERLHERDTRQAAARERQHLARELHDAVTQTIYSATLIADALPDVWERDPGEARRSLVTLQRLVRGALAEMRTLLFELRPGALREAPLDTLFERLGAALSGQIQVPVEVRVDEAVAVPPDVKIVLYRVAQEAFSNIGKHARATEVSAGLVADDDGATLTVKDDGRGFDPPSVAPGRMGLRIMQERLDQIGATITVDSAATEGTTIVVEWPRPRASASTEREEDGGGRLEEHQSDDRG